MYICVMQSWMSFGKIAKDLVMRMLRIDENNYPEVKHLPFLQKDTFLLLMVYISLIDYSYHFQTLHHMYIINAGGGFKCLWNWLKGFLDPRTTAKINVKNPHLCKTV